MWSLKSCFLSPLCAALAAAAVAGPAPAEEAARKVYQQALRATALVLVKTPTGVASGTGWIADRGGRLLVTNYHVVEAQDTVLICFPVYRKGRVVAERGFYAAHARPIRGKVIDGDPRRDLALVELASLPAEVEALPLAAESPGPGDRVHSVGNPGASGALWVYTSGTVRQVYVKKIRLDTRQRIEARVIETQSPINAGDSGGPVVDDDGRLIGVTSSTLAGPGVALMSYCIDVSEVRAFLDETRPLLRPRTAAEYNRRGVHYYNRGRFPRAVADFTEAIRLDDRWALYYRNRGTAFVRKGEYVTAIADLDEVLRRDPKDDLAYSWRGWAYYLSGDKDKAIADCTQAIRLNPKDPGSYRVRACAHHDKRDYVRALADCDEGLHLDPKDPLLYYRRGWIYYDRRQYGRAIADYTEALKFDHPWPSVVYRGRALAWHDKGEYQKAVNDFSACLRLDPRDWIAYKNRGNCFYEFKLYKKAIADLYGGHRSPIGDPRRLSRRPLPLPRPRLPGRGRPQPGGGGHPGGEAAGGPGQVTAGRAARAASGREGAGRKCSREWSAARGARSCPRPRRCPGPGRASRARGLVLTPTPTTGPPSSSSATPTEGVQPW
jgi:tetratricopeptide (TPR) repeat protein